MVWTAQVVRQVPVVHRENRALVVHQELAVHQVQVEYLVLAGLVVLVLIGLDNGIV